MAKKKIGRDERFEFEMRLRNMKKEVENLSKYVDSIRRALDCSTLDTGAIVPYGVTSDIRQATQNIDALVAYLRGRKDAVDGRGLIA